MRRNPYPRVAFLRRPLQVLAAVSVAGLAASPLAAQGSNASLSGIVRDASGAEITHARITILEQNKAMQRTAETNNAGLYAVPQLSPGPYRITVEAPGFAISTRDIVLTVGEHAGLDVQLKVASAQADVTVNSSTEAILEHTDPSLSTVTDERTIRQLPLNGRDITQLALLSPGVVPSRRVNPDSQGLGRQISISGRRTNQVAFMLDGTDVNDAYNNTPGGASGNILGVDSVAQFRVLVNGFGAEFGRTGGGVIDEITRSGTDGLHGSLFEFARNSAFDAKNYFDSATLPIPHFSRNQFGGSLGGPIGKRTFYFGNYEGVRQELGITTSALVPNATARASAVAAVRPFLAIIPSPNNTIFSDGTGYFRSTSATSTNEDFFIVRVDRQISDRTSIFARYQFDNANVRTPDSLQIASSHNRSRTQYLTGQATHSFTRNLVNQVRASYNRSFYTLQYDFLKDIDPSLSFVPGNPFGSISVTGLAMIGPMRFGPNVNILNLFQGSDDLTFVHGRHTVALGVDERQIIFPQEAAQSQNGFYQFTSVANFMAGIASSVEIAQAGSNPQRKWRQHMDAAYITDTYRAGDSLSITAGLRYERPSVPSEVNGLQATVRDVLRDRADTVGPLYTNPSNRNLAPRLGFAYTPGKSGNTSIRGAFGLYFDPLWTDFYLNSGSRQPPFFTVGTVNSGITFPKTTITPANFILGRIDVVQYHPASPYVMQWNASVQQQLAPGAVLTVAYNANRGVHDQRIVDENQALPQIVNGRKFFPANSTVRNTAFTAIRMKQTNGSSIYHSLQATLSYQLRQSLQLRTSYIFGKAIDNGTVVTAQGTENDLPQDPDDLRAERGLSNYDLRNYFSTALTANLPRFTKTAWLGAGWQLNGIALLSSGAPFSALVSFDSARARFGTGPSPERPDLTPGYSSNPVQGGPTQYFNPAAFTMPQPGFYGNLGRNTMIGPGLVSIDGALNKTFSFGDRRNLQLRAEVFNIPNRPNFAIPNQRNVFQSSPVNAATNTANCINFVAGNTTCTTRTASAGQITATLSSSRQIQLGARFEF